MQRAPRYSLKEFSQRGEEIFRRVIEPQLSAADRDKFVAIDIESEDFEVDANDFMSTERLIQRRPDSQIWLVRVGHRAAHSLGYAGPANAHVDRPG